MVEQFDTLRERHADLDEAVRRTVRTISNFAATLDVLERPDTSRIEASLEATKHCLDELASWLTWLRETLTRVRNDDEAPSFEDLVACIEQLEPPPKPPEQAVGAEDESSGEAMFESASPLNLLSAPYDVLLEAEGSMFRERIKRPYRMIELKRLWSDVTYIGERRSGARWTARLSLLHEWTSRAGRDTPDDAPWCEEDLVELRELVDRTETLLVWDRETIEDRERQRWLDRVSDWVETAESEPETAGETTEMMMRFLTECPEAPDDRVLDLLERIETNEDFQDEVRRAAREARAE